MRTVYVVLTVAAARGWHLHQMDVKNVFLQGDLQVPVVGHIRDKGHGEPSLFPQILVIHTPTGILLTQRHNVLNMLYKFGIKKW